MSTKNKVKVILASLFPIALLVLVFIFVPQPKVEVLMAILTDLYSKYGYLIVFIAAFIESLLFLSLYLPGSTAVLLGAILAAKGVLFLPWVIIAAFLGITLAYLLDYFLGKYGWYKLLAKFGFKDSIENAKRRLNSKRKNRIIFLTCIHPNSGSISATASGVLSLEAREMLLKFASAALFWSSFWGILFFYYGQRVLDFAVRYLFFILIIVFSFLAIKKIIAVNKKINDSEAQTN